MRKYIITHRIDFELAEIDKPTEVGLYYYNMPHWDEPQQVSVLKRNGELVVHFARETGTTPLGNDWPADAIWLQKKSHLYTNGFIIANHYCHSLASFLAMVAEARKAFPELKDADVECRTVQQSGWCKRCPIIQFSLGVGSEAEGWTQQERLTDVSW